MALRIGIAGAGLMGRLLAQRLVKAGHQIDLYDRDDASGQASCAWTAAAMLAPISEADHAEAVIVELGLASLRQWPGLLQELPEPVFFQQQGSLLVAHPQDDVELERFWANLPDAYKSQIETTDTRRIQALEPSLGRRFQRGFFLPNEGQLDNYAWLQASLRGLQEWGVNYHPLVDVTDVSPHQLTINGQTQRYDWAIDCRGLGAQPQLPKLRGVRGEVMRFHAPEVSLNRPVRLMHPRYHLYIVPRPEQQFVIGASEIESQDMSPISVRSSLELLSAVYSLDPAFAEARITQTSVNCRPALPDNNPSIRWRPGLMHINGLYRHGYLMGPAVSADACAVIQQQAPQFPSIVTDLQQS